ncbi:uncharacterized protein CBO05P1_102 [Clostridium botulinum B str. Osaka05]|uniref:Uncharacterized protein n=1 Tax=Clostridium botulinum B str. Osaka05 TaxID=1407017 RepID=A0A060N334_CLOBO|nr:hypothetical protein [Clostridium botulinum]BAO04821.1 uncharacterized protein CBO05P1_102 [Clostridium botulinum B str. Osaka05]
MSITNTIIISVLLLIGFYAIYGLIQGIKQGDAFICFLCIITILITLGLPLGAFYEHIQDTKATKDMMPIILKIENKEHKNAWTQVIYNGKTTSCIYHAEQNNIIVTDGENEETIDNIKLYNALNKGDKVKGYKILYKKKNGEIYKTELKIKEDNKK